MDNGYGIDVCQEISSIGLNICLEQGVEISDMASSCHSSEYLHSSTSFLFATKELLRPILDIVKTFISWKLSGTTESPFSVIAKSCDEFGTNNMGTY